MSYVQYTVSASCSDDHAAADFEAWIGDALDDRTLWGPGSPHRGDFDGPFVVNKEPAPATKRPRVDVVFLFENEDNFQAYRKAAGPPLRDSFAARFRETPDNPGDGAAGATQGAAKPKQDEPEPRQAEPKKERRILLDRSTVYIPRIGPYAWQVPILFCFFIILAVVWASAVLSAVLEPPLAPDQMPAASGRGAGRVPDHNEEQPADAGTAQPETRKDPGAAKDGDSRETKPTERQSLFKRRVDRNSLFLAWMASYVAFIGVGVLMIISAARVFAENFIGKEEEPLRSWRRVTQVHEALRTDSVGAQVRGFYRAVRMAAIRKYRLFALMFVFVALGALVAIRLVPLPFEMPLLKRTQVRIVEWSVLIGLVLLAVFLMAAFSSLLYPQKPTNPQPIPITVYLRLKQARQLLNNSAAVLICCVVEIALLKGAALPDRFTTAAGQYPARYAFAWGTIFTVMLLGFYLPTIDALYSWGHKFILANSAELTHDERVAMLEKYGAGARAEFRPLLSTIAGLAPVSVGVLGNLLTLLPGGG